MNFEQGNIIVMKSVYIVSLEGPPHLHEHPPPFTFIRFVQHITDNENLFNPDLDWIKFRIDQRSTRPNTGNYDVSI